MHSSRLMPVDMRIIPKRWECVIDVKKKKEIKVNMRHIRTYSTSILL